MRSMRKRQILHKLTETQRHTTGFVAGPPDFVGVGAQRCGTTRWFYLMLQHPQVFSAIEPDDAIEQRRFHVLKERHFCEQYPSGEIDKYDIAKYHNIFPRPKGMKTGEWTPRYLFLWWSPQVLKAIAPDTQLIIILRDPVERYISHINFLPQKKVPFEKITRAFGRGLYFNQVCHFFQYFNKEQILILQYEKCCASPEEELKRTYNFIGVDDSFKPSGIARVLNSTSAIHSLSSATRQTLTDAYKNDVDNLCNKFPEIDRSLWKNFK